MQVFFGGGCSGAKGARRRGTHGFCFISGAGRAVKPKRGQEQSLEPVVAGELAPDCEPVYGHHD